MRKTSAILFLVAVGCSQTSEFAERAAFELRCKESDLEFVEIGKNTWGVRGCNRQATYQRIGKNWIKADEKETKN